MQPAQVSDLVIWANTMPRALQTQQSCDVHGIIQAYMYTYWKKKEYQEKWNGGQAEIPVPTKGVHHCKS